MSKTSATNWDVTHPVYYKFSAPLDVIAELGWYLVELGVPRLYWTLYPERERAVPAVHHRPLGSRPPQTTPLSARPDTHRARGGPALSPGTRGGVALLGHS